MLNNMFYHLFRLCLTCIDKNAIDLKGRVHKGAVKKGERYIICSGFIGQDLYMLNNMFYHLFRLCLTCIDKNAIDFRFYYLTVALFNCALIKVNRLNTYDLVNDDDDDFF